MFRVQELLCALFFAMWISGSLAHGQSSGQIGGYTLGFVFDSRNSNLRPLVGIPGAAVLGAGLDAGVAIRRAYVSPRENYAVALSDGGAVVISLNSLSAPPAVRALGFDSSAAGVVALSSDGSAGAFYSVDEGLIRVVTGLPDAPSITGTIPAGAVTGAIRLLAISNDAAALAAAVDGSDMDAVVRIDASGNGLTLLNSSHISAMQFMGDTKDLLVADDLDDTVSLIQDVPGSALPRQLAGASDGISGPVGLNIVSGQNLLVVANGRGGNIFVFDPNGSQRATYTCPCTPAALNRLNGNSVFLLNNIADNGPLWLFDGDSTAPRVMFIPVDQGGTSGAVQ